MYILLSNISPSLEILNATLSYCIYSVMHKSTLITYFINNTYDIVKETLNKK